MTIFGWDITQCKLQRARTDRHINATLVCKTYIFIYCLFYPFVCRSFYVCQNWNWNWNKSNPIQANDAIKTEFIDHEPLPFTAEIKISATDECWKFDTIYTEKTYMICVHPVQPIVPCFKFRLRIFWLQFSERWITPQISHSFVHRAYYVLNRIVHTRVYTFLVMYLHSRAAGKAVSYLYS